MNNLNFKKAIRDWKIIVSVFAIILISLSIFAWRIDLSNQIAGGYFMQEVTMTDPLLKTLDKKKLDAGLLILKTKEAEFLKLKANRPKSVDPSL